MHEVYNFEKLKEDSARISEELGGTTFIIVVGGAGEQNIPRTMAAAHINGQDMWSKRCSQE